MYALVPCNKKNLIGIKRLRQYSLLFFLFGKNEFIYSSIDYSGRVHVIMYSSLYTVIVTAENIWVKRERKIISLFCVASTSSGIIVRPNLLKKSSDLDLNIWNSCPTWFTGEIIRPGPLKWSSDLVYWKGRPTWTFGRKWSSDLVY